jgi:hypothetical protein
MGDPFTARRPACSLQAHRALTRSISASAAPHSTLRGCMASAGDSCTYSSSRRHSHAVAEHHERRGQRWKMEGALARFCRQHLAATLAANVQPLLTGLGGSQPDLPAHAVQSLDWAHPTAGELGWPPPQPSDRHHELAAQRNALTAQCVALLGDRPQLQARFQALLKVAQRYAVLREQQARQLTLGWPLRTAPGPEPPRPRHDRRARRGLLPDPR